MYNIMTMNPDKLLEKASKLINNKSIFNFFSDNNLKYDEAEDLLKKAINLYKIQSLVTKNETINKLKECYNLLIQIYEKTNNNNIGNIYLDGSNIINDINEKIVWLSKALVYFKENGKFKEVGDCYYNIAETHDDFIEWKTNILESINYYSLDKFSKNKMISLYDLLITKQIQNNSNINDIIQNINNILEIIDDIYKQNTQIYSTKYITLLLLCYLTTNDNYIRRYDDIINKYPFFENTSDSKMIQKIMKTIDDNDLDEFTYVLQEHNSTLKLTSNCVNLLSIIRNKFTDCNDLL